MYISNIFPTSASFLLAETCNIACTYCWINTANAFCKKFMSKEIAQKSLDYLCENAIKSKTNNFSVILFGGEPTLNPDIIEFVFDYGSKLAENHKIKFTASIITNATIMNDRLKDIFIKYKHKVSLNCQLSVDGKKESQDLYRVTKDGKGSFDMVEKNIPIYKEIFADMPNALSIHGCVNKQTMSKLYENYKFFRDEWGFSTIWFMPIHDIDWTEDDVIEYENQLGLIHDNIINIIKSEKSINEIYNYAPLDRCFNTTGFPSHPCSAGRSFISITAEGDIYPCHQFYFDDPTKTSKIGNISDGIDDLKRKIFLDYTQEDLCSGCDCNNCYRCIAENFYINGSMVSQIKGVRCQLSRVERNFQLKLQKELKDMGLFDNNKNNYTKGNNPNNPDCLCDSRGGSDNNQNKGINNCNCGDESDIKEALKLLLQKVDYIESVQEVILKKLLR